MKATHHMKKETGSHSMIRALLHEDVSLIFGYPGGAIMPFYDALYDFTEDIRHILVRHEQAAVHAACGFARVSGKVGVVVATSGPGATNLVTGIADAMADSVPVVCITGQVASSLLGSDAFQEVDIIGITAPITKWNYQITDPKEIPEVFAKAFYIAKTGRPGPVLIDITKDAQLASCEYIKPHMQKIAGYEPTTMPHKTQILRAAELLNSAQRPLVIAGHGVHIARAWDILQKGVEKADLPVATTLHGISALPQTHKNFVGWLGMHGNYAPNMLTNRADVILALGMRFDDRVTGKLARYAPQAKVIHIDIDPAEINKNVPAYLPIVADVRLALEELYPHLSETKRTSWHGEFKKLHKQEVEMVKSKDLAEDTMHITMAQAIHTLSQVTHGEAVVVADVGQHQMKTCQYYAFQKVNSFISSGGMGTMGFALPAGMGAALTTNRNVVSICGDGSFQMNSQELATIMQDSVPLKIVILNNHYLGMVRQWQELFHDKKYSFTHLMNPDFVALAKAYGMPAKCVKEKSHLKQAIEDMMNADGPYLLEIDVCKEENVFPMIPPGAGVDEVVLSV